MAARPDGRKAEDLRPVHVVYEGLDRSDGSAQFSFGKSTPTLTSVSGPIEPRPQSEHPSYTSLEIYVRPLHSLPSTQARHVASVLKTIFSQTILLNQHPRTLVQMVVQALSVSEVVGKSGVGAGTAGVFGPGTIASMVNSASLALINAGSIPLRGVVCAVSVGRLTRPSPSNAASTSPLILDPSPEEIPHLTAQGVFAFLFSSALPASSRAPSSGSPPPSELIWSNWSSTNLGMTKVGDGELQELGRAHEMAREGAIRVWWEMRRSVPEMEAGAARSKRAAAEPAGQAGGAGSGEESDSDDDEERMEI
ncbi:hypothetical protein GLOTRDRAFT_65299 [Gloeophyllum trabeum ATCC 11539]|uniref:Exoribonuclease phosphorolytic domain-containing protein n=1 Tax=Gloeophyllum trabeum (strain ATCC 11539 / FP-39264 / Madison 617) TaxID=670483 RepID=S7PW26_GLOTA|nr:uncharacterized protein GLOTRDRAFT_65299 [Gloeophyllum trabeum ATCC 11539]EPQ51723.1 hypothetical protein GLOTRDRAFT_65299 [Gloeophyllum trabeum ATCC 11539]